MSAAPRGRYHSIGGTSMSSCSYSEEGPMERWGLMREKVRRRTHRIALVASLARPTSLPRVRPLSLL
jgi:hypothetical protein